MATQSETLQVTGIRCERCVNRLAVALRGHEGLDAANANLMGQVVLQFDDEQTSREALVEALAHAGFRELHVVEPGITPARRAFSPSVHTLLRLPGGRRRTRDRGRRIASQARDRVRFEEEALSFADQVYRVARRLVGTREEAEDLVQETYSRAFRSWRSYTPGTNLRAWLLRILTNLNLDRGRKIQRTPDMQPLEEGDYYLANKMAEAQGEQALDQEKVVEKLSRIRS